MQNYNKSINMNNKKKKKKGARIPTGIKTMMGSNMYEDEAIILQFQFVDGPFHGELAVLVFIDGHGRRNNNSALV